MWLTVPRVPNLREVGMNGAAWIPFELEVGKSSVAGISFGGEVGKPAVRQPGYCRGKIPKSGEVGTQFRANDLFRLELKSQLRNQRVSCSHFAQKWNPCHDVRLSCRDLLYNKCFRNGGMVTMAYAE